MMQAKVIAIESGSQYFDGRRRVRLKFLDDDPLNVRNVITISERKLGIVGLKLDDTIEVAWDCDAIRIREERKKRLENTK
jgi:hypothetical protein